MVSIAGSDGGVARRAGLRRAMGVLVACAALGAAGCDMFKSAPKRPQPCPHFLLLGDADTLTDFRPGPGRDVTDVDTRAAIANFQGKCDYVDDDMVEVQLLIDFVVQRGPANESGEAAFRYFVAIPRFHPEPAGKKIFDVKLKFEDRRTRLGYRDEIYLEFPIGPSEVGASYEVYMGFQLTTEQLEYNRRRVKR
jgi:hypothetical protein